MRPVIDGRLEVAVASLLVGAEIDAVQIAWHFDVHILRHCDEAAIKGQVSCEHARLIDHVVTRCSEQLVARFDQIVRGKHENPEI